MLRINYKKKEKVATAGCVKKPSGKKLPACMENLFLLKKRKAALHKLAVGVGWWWFDLGEGGSGRDVRLDVWKGVIRGVCLSSNRI